jgi:hypothetical protein
MSYSLYKNGSLYAFANGATNSTGGTAYVTIYGGNISGTLTGICSWTDSVYGSDSAAINYWLLNSSFIINRNNTLAGAFETTKCSEIASDFTCGALGVGIVAGAGSMFATFNPIFGTFVAMLTWAGLIQMGFFDFLTYLNGSPAAWSVWSIVFFVVVLITMKKLGYGGN